MTILCKIDPTGVFSLQQRDSALLLCMLHLLSNTGLQLAANQSDVFSLPLVQGRFIPAAASQQQSGLSLESTGKKAARCTLAVPHTHANGGCFHLMYRAMAWYWLWD